MAAHSLRILLEMADTLQDGISDEWVERYSLALGYAPGMGELDHEDWLGLRCYLEGGDVEEIFRTVLAVLGTQADKWLERGRPVCHEDWVRGSP